MKKKALIVVDMQNDFIDGALGTKEAVAIVPNVKKKIAKYLANGDSIVFTRDTHGTDYLDTHEGKNLPVAHCVDGTAGWEIPQDIDIPNAVHVDKHRFGFLNWWALECEDFCVDYYDDIEIVGLCTDICVVSNALILRSLLPETEITVDASCCAGVTPEKHKAALEVMRSCQIKIIGE